MTDDDFSAEDERDLMAAALALGLLDGEEEARARDLAAREPDFALAVARWRGRLAGLSDEIEPVEPPAELFARIQRAIAARKMAANDNRLQRSLAWWRGAAGTAGAIAAALALVLVLRPTDVTPPTAPATVQPEPQPPLVATIAGDASELKMVASFDPATRKLLVTAAVPDTIAPGRSRQLWMIPAGGKPVPMGVMHGAPLQQVLTEAQAAQFAPGLTLAVSDEPEGGSPTGQPTGAVLATGTLARV